MKTSYKVIAAALMASTAQLAHAEFNPYGAIQGTYMFPDSDRNTNNAGGGILTFGFMANDYLAPEINVFGLATDRKHSNAADSTWGGGIDLAFYPVKRTGSISPFLLIGGGGQYEDRFLDDGGYGFADIGVGALFNLNKSGSAAVRFDVKEYFVFADDVDPSHDYLTDTRINLGLQFDLGSLFKRSSEKVVVVQSAAPTAQDTDGDGVVDKIDQCPGTPDGTKVDAKGCPLVAAKDSDGDGVDDSIDACPNTPRGFKVDARGCATRDARIVLHDINFEFDSSRLTATAKAELDKIAVGLKGQPTMGLTIEGHTDATGPDAYNMKLSKDRASAARAYLISQGVAGSRLEAVGYGETKPMASNKTKDGRAENRRVEFRVTHE
ncbi:MAG TPA: OmpA family protein [Solimonas sp.]|nr:OmpA family protein [Solimonas sp.]